MASTPIIRTTSNSETTPIMSNHQNTQTTQITRNYRSTETTPIIQNTETTQITRNYQSTNTSQITQNSPNTKPTQITTTNSQTTQTNSTTIQNYQSSAETAPNSDPAISEIASALNSPVANNDNNNLSSGKGKRSMALLTLVTFLFACAGKIHSPVLTQYVYQIYTESVYGNESAGVHISKHPCLNLSDSDGLGNASRSSAGGEDPRNDEVQDKSADLLMRLDMVSGGISVLVNLLLGSYSDRLGRRFILLVSTFGHFVRNASIPVIIYWGLGLPALYVGYAVDGLCGGSSGILLGLYVYTADITRSDKQRTLGMAIVETGIGLTAALSSLGTGYFIEDAGFFYPSLASSLLLLVNALVIIFCLPETVSRDRKQCFSPLEGARRVLGVFLFRTDARKGRLLLLGLLTFFLAQLPEYSDTKLRTLYVMDHPFCWSSIQMGVFVCVKDGGARIISLLFIQLLRACVMTPLLGMMGAASLLGSDVLMALAENDLMAYMVAVVSMGSSMMLPSIRSMMSQNVPPDQQGALFAGIGVVESVCFCVSQLCFLSLYRATAPILPGMVYLIIGGFHLMVICCLIIYVCLMRTTPPDDEAQPINIQEEEPSIS